MTEVKRNKSGGNRDPFWDTVASFGIDEVFVNSEQVQEQNVKESAKHQQNKSDRHLSKQNEKQPAGEKRTPVKPVGNIGEEMTSLLSRIGDCEGCRLGKTRTNLVFGEGNPESGIVIVGEAPGATEDEQGRPFVGKSGKLLDKILVSIDLDRTKVFITNIVKCRPPGNKDPKKDEVAACWWILEEQIRTMQPGIIVTLGSPASKALSGSTEGIGILREKELEFNGVPLLCTYHPAALLRNPAFKRPVWEDMKRLRVLLGELGLPRNGDNK